MSLSVILVNPEISQNVGFVARSMKCYNMNSLRIVGRKYPPQSYAYKTGCAAVDILDNAGYYKTLAEALSDINIAMGFTCRKREEGEVHVQKMTEVIPVTDFSQNVALVFGCESQGLSRDDCLLMNRLVKIELPNDLSLNLSHAAAIAFHEIFTHGLLTDNPLNGPPVKKRKGSSFKKKKTAAVSQPDFGDREDTFEYFLEILEKKKVFPVFFTQDIKQLGRIVAIVGSACQKIRSWQIIFNGGSQRAARKRTYISGIMILLCNVDSVRPQVRPGKHCADAFKADRNHVQRKKYLGRHNPGAFNQDIEVVSSITGKDDHDNVEIRRWGEKPEFSFTPKSHAEITEDLGIADFERAAKVAGAGFYYLRNEFALLDHALQRYAIDFLLKQGYALIEPPYMLRRAAYEGVTDLADFESVMYKVKDEDLYLIATSEHSRKITV